MTTQAPPGSTAEAFGQPCHVKSFTAHVSPARARPGVALLAKCWGLGQNVCRLFLIKVWFQMAAVLGAICWWLSKRDGASTLATVSIIMMLSLWMMSRERMRRSMGGRADDDWFTFERPLLCLDEINQKRKAQERKDRIAFRVGMVCTVLAAIVGMIGF